MALDTDRWTSIWNTISALKGLEKLQVKLKSLLGKTFNEESTLSVLEPFGHFKGLQELLVHVDWQLSSDFVEKRTEEGLIGFTCANSGTWRV